MASPDFLGWRRGFYLPTSSDAGVVTLRQWLEQAAGGVQGLPRSRAS
jgi:hypothetical protein